MAYLLDTNILSDLMRNPQGAVCDRIVDAGEDRVATSIIVAAELRFGARKKGSQNLIDRVDLILSGFSILPWEPGMDSVYADIRADLEAAGTPIGANDLLIAAQAIFLDRILVTANRQEFERVKALETTNWIEEQLR